MREEPLAGGNSSTVVRVGDTVRRTPGPWTPSVHLLLATLRGAGLTEVPEPLGFDAGGREVLGYLPGVVGNYPLPDWLWEPHLLDEAGRLLRRVHDLSVPLLSSGGSWGSAGHDPEEVICHNDVAPYNMTFVEGHLTGLFDFDAASPGPRLWDLAYLAYRLVPYAEDATGGDFSMDERRERTRQLLDAYGSPHTVDALHAVMAVRLHELAAYSDGRALESGNTDFSLHAAMYRRDSDRLSSHPH